MKNKGVIEKFFKDQLSVWKTATTNYRLLRDVEVKDFLFNGLYLKIQYNPSRSISSNADVSKEAISKRPCFLCSSNRDEEQSFINFEGRKNRKYQILINPYPIFTPHLVIADINHKPQLIWKRIGDVLDLAHHYTDFTFFYNGGKCGASAPDHFHFQGCPRHLLPVENDVDNILDIIAQNNDYTGVPNGEEDIVIPQSVSNKLSWVSSIQEAQVFHYKGYTNGVFVFRGRTSKSIAKLLYRFLDSLPIAEGEKEPRVNMLFWYSPLSKVDSERPSGYTHGLAKFEYRAVVFCRDKHRPDTYYEDGLMSFKFSPGAVDMAGVFILTRNEDYDKINTFLIRNVLGQVSISSEVEKDIIWRLQRKQQQISVGIAEEKSITFEILTDGAGKRTVFYDSGKLNYNGVLYDELYFDAKTLSTMFAEPNFRIYNVSIGKNFHWQRTQNQVFAGALKLIVNKGKILAINIIGIEDYLLSVISSEMKATSPLEYLKAHAIISRSWLMSKIRSRRECVHKSFEKSSLQEIVTKLNTSSSQPSEYIHWFDHKDHSLFDVCADDHCQRYQGLSFNMSFNVKKAVEQTWGEILVYGDEICDTRFSKCCGGRTELFSTCWEDVDKPYLLSQADTPNHDDSLEPFCKNPSPVLLKKVLNDYDLDTKDFYDWEDVCDKSLIVNKIKDLLHIDIGEILDLQVLERGKSGRIIKLNIIGSKSSVVVGKELIIRKLLSETHLRSSNIDFSLSGDKIIIKGRGWGHGVGLCQIGAAVMADEGYSYIDILHHYYKDAEIKKI